MRESKLLPGASRALQTCRLMQPWFRRCLRMRRFRDCCEQQSPAHQRARKSTCAPHLACVGGAPIQCENRRKTCIGASVHHAVWCVRVGRVGPYQLRQGV